MKECKIVVDLWPLYVDGEISEESRRFIEKHLENCSDCRKLTGKNSVIGIDQLLEFNEKSNGSAENFILKLRARFQKITATIILIVFIIVAGTWYYSSFATQKAFEKEREEEQRLFKEQLVVLDKVSPSSNELLDKLGISFSIQKAQLQNKEISINYALLWGADSPVEWLMTDTNYWFDEDLLLDAETGSSLPLSQSGSSSGLGEGLKGEVKTIPLDNKVNKVILKTKTLYATMKRKEPSFSFNFTYDGTADNVKVNKKFLFRDVEFMIDSLELGKEEIKVIYRQITSAAEVGVYQLTFSFNDRLGNNWTSEPQINLDVNNPREYIFKTPSSPSKNWILEAQVVQVIPGFETEIDIEEGN